AAVVAGSRGRAAPTRARAAAATARAADRVGVARLLADDLFLAAVDADAELEAAAAVAAARTAAAVLLARLRAGLVVTARRAHAGVVTEVLVGALAGPGAALAASVVRRATRHRQPDQPEHSQEMPHRARY